MISVDELLYEFELKLNSLDREKNQNIPLENKIVFLNNAQVAWIKSRLNPNNVLKIGYEGVRKRIDDLQKLKINNKKLQLSSSNNERFIGIDGELSSVSDYMFYISSFAKAKTKTCSATVGINLIKEGELETLYYNENFKPSFKWRDTIATIGSDKLHVYTNGEFVIEDIRLTYLRKPLNIDAEGYVKLDGTDSVNQDCELPEYAKNDIVDIAVRYAAQATGDMMQVQMAKERESNNE